MLNGTERGVWLSEHALNALANDLCCNVDWSGYSTVGAAMAKIEGIKTMQNALLEMISGKCDMPGPEYWGASGHAMVEWLDDFRRGDDRVSDKTFPADYEGGTIETNVFDEVEIYPNCTVQILKNSVTGEESIGWWVNESADEDI